MRKIQLVQAESFDEVEFFRAIHRSGARALLIGRRALIAIGIYTETFDYDFWLHRDDIDLFNAALEPMDLFPNRTPEQARQRGIYILEGEEKVDVWVARIIPTIDGQRVSFEDIWTRRRTTQGSGAPITVPDLRDLILTKRFGNRPKDAEDVRRLEALLRVEEEAKQKP